GTARGLARALDVATDGSVSAGRIVIVEDFRLRRTFATILGAHLSDADDPLLHIPSDSGNSFVGDSLFLGETPALPERFRADVLPLFGAGLPETADEQAIRAFLDAMAHRVTILVHEEAEPQDLGRIRRVVAAEVPAHVEARVTSASDPFLVGIASLVGVDTY